MSNLFVGVGGGALSGRETGHPRVNQRVGTGPSWGRFQGLALALSQAFAGISH